MSELPFSAQLIHLFAALVLLLSFAMLAQRRIRTLINLFALQGAALVCSTAIVAFSSAQHHLYYSAALTLTLKVLLLSWILHRLVLRLGLRSDTETELNIPATMLIGMMLVVFCFGLAQPISALASTVTRGTYGMPMVVELGIALDVLVGAIILGIFFFQIREQFDSLDLHHLEALRED